MLPPLLSITNVKEDQLMVQALWGSYVALCKGEVEELACSARMGKLVEDKLDDYKGWHLDPLLEGIW